MVLLKEMANFAVFTKELIFYMKRNLLFIYALLCVFSAWAAPRSQEQAAVIARKFLAASNPSSVATRTAGHISLAATSSDLPDTPSKRSGDAQPAFYIYNRGTDAFVIISGDDRMETVLGYSEDGAFVTENLPDNIKNWLIHYVQAFRNMEQTTVTPKRTATQTGFAASVAPLLGDIQYNQDVPYNNACPTYNGERCFTGCVATAVAQIMRYWQYPSAGTGSKSYRTLTHNISCSYDFSAHPFDWDNMLPAYTGNETPQETNAVGNLMLACGMACEMDFGTDVSGAFETDMFKGLIDYLQYDENMYLTQRAFYTSDEWMALLKTELNEKRPVYYGGYSTGGGHAFVVDGYDRDDKVHVNWGWGGYCNGYFEIQTLNASGSGIGGYDDSSYQFTQSMMVGLQPKSGTTEYVSRFRIAALKFANETVTAGNTFTATVTDMYNMASTFNGSIGLILEKDGKQTLLASQKYSNIKSNYGKNKWNINMNFPASLADGTYKLYVASKADNESSWNETYGDLMEPCVYTMVKQGNTCWLYANNFNIEKQLTGTIQTTHNLYTGYEAGFDVTVRNTDSSKDFFGELGVSIFDENYVLIQRMSCKQALLNAGEEIQFKVNNIIGAEPGSYIVWITAGTSRYDYYPGERQYVTVKEAAPGTPTLVVQGCTLETAEVYGGDMLPVRATLSLSGNGSINTTWLHHSCTRSGETEIISEAWDLPFVESGTPMDYRYDFPIVLQPGTYAYTLRALHPITGLMKNIFTTTFIVFEGSGIKDAVAESGKPYVYSVAGENRLHIRTSAEPEHVTIYNMAGQAVARLQPESAGNGEYLVPANDLGKGTYIMVVGEKGGNRHSVKFIR